jgi:O-Antigen ligase.
MIESTRNVGRAGAIQALLLAGLVGINLVNPAFNKIFLLLIWSWVFIGTVVYFKLKSNGEQVLLGAMYLFVATTFLNQLLMSVSVGFFTLFIYRLMLVVCVCLFLRQSFVTRDLSASWARIQVKGPVLFLLAWLTYGGISLIWSVSVSDGLKYLFLLGIGILFVLLSVFLFDRVERLKTFHGLWMLMSAVLITIGLINFFGRIQLPTSILYGGPAYKQGFPTATFTNQNDFSTLLSLSFFFYLAWLRQHLKSRLNMTILILMVLSGVITVLADSRASELGIAAGLMFYLLLLLPRRLRKTVFWSAGVVLAASLFLFLRPLMTLVNRFLAVSASYSPFETTASGSVRIHLLQSAVSSLADSFGFGVGPGNISYVLENSPLFNTDHIYQVHNWIAEIMANFGMLIGAGYLLMYLSLFLSLYRIYRCNIGREAKMLAETCMTAQIAFLISSIGPSSVSNLYFHWVFLGFVMATVSVLKNESAAHSAGKHEGAI